MLRIGVAIFTEKGFHNTTVDELVAAAGIPKGSFTYYFGSKDAYTHEVIKVYAAYFHKKLTRALQDASRSPLERIQGFIHEARDGVERFHYRRGCLVGNLGQEMGALDNRFRESLVETLRDWQSVLQTCLIEGVECGEVRADADPGELAQFFWYAWEGAVLCSKLEQSSTPLEIVGSAFLKHIAAQPAGRKTRRG
ncbi:hypothetical protein CAL29_05835 [Bordetella genomosp. 10]|uniref:HTH tetR-type domain-containing protein n=2 Tax=Bordetella genomosp. 10 TaxID=1416804 RepID=A0A261SLJ4_9BORD|nr:hypothetical protein CAL29_05835 [Bordetella genomosp. 10]